VTANAFSVSGDHDVPEVVSVTFKPEALTTFEEWRMVLVRFAPGSDRPALKTLFGAVYIPFAFGFLGFLIGAAGSPGLQPDTMALAGFAMGLLYPFRLWRIKTMLVKSLRGVGPVTVELDRDHVSILSKNRVTRIDWAGVLELRASPKEIALKYSHGDLSWIPTRVFADHEHEARFLRLAEHGLARSRHDPAWDFAQGGR
jgi:hypothetical protein